MVVLHLSRSALLACAGAVGLAVAMFHRSATQRAQVVRLSLQNLHALTERCVKVKGYTDDEVQLITDILLYAQLRGNNQGLIKLVTNAIPARSNTPPPTITQTSSVSAVLDGRGRLGMLVLHAAAKEAAQLAKDHGVGIVGTVNTASTTGALGFYADALAKQGLVTLVMAQSPELMNPYGTHVAFFGTNPIAFGMPTREPSKPLVLDMATSAMAYYGVVEAAMKGDAIPDNVAFSRGGRRTQNPREVLAGGALRPFDRSHKSSGLALMVELFTGALVGGALVDKANAHNWGNLVIAINPKLFQPDAATLASRVSTVASAIRALPPLPDHEVRMPGDASHRRFQSCVATGSITLPRSLYEALRQRTSTDSRATTQG